MLVKLRERDGITSRVEWLEEDLVPRTFRLRRPVFRWSRFLRLSPGPFQREGDILRVESSGEAMRVVSVDAYRRGRTRVRVQRAVGSMRAPLLTWRTHVFCVSNSGGGS